MDGASTSTCTRQLETLKLSDTSCKRSGSHEAPDNLTAPSSDVVLAMKSSTLLSTVEERIEQSKSHWSILADREKEPHGKWQKLIFCCSNNEDEEVAEVSNVKVFKNLQRHPTWGSFVEKSDRFAKFVVGEKFAQGAQAELYHVQVMWQNPMWNESDQKRGVEYVLKVFMKGTFLQDLKLQVPRGFLDARVEMRKWPPNVKVPRFHSFVTCGVLLKDGRFAFLMQKEQFDLRSLIERNMKSTSGGRRGPFSKVEAECIMYHIALGVDWLHNHNIIHRDLKASNVLVNEYVSGSSKWYCYVADFESSVGVIGTGFFRAPEILQACKDQKLRERPEVFSKAADIYSFGMVWYEVLTGKLPFEGHFQMDYDLVLNGQHPAVPNYVEDWTCELLHKCWQLDPTSRPQIGDILELLLANSIDVREFEENLKNRWGQNYRDWSPIKKSNS